MNDKPEKQRIVQEYVPGKQVTLAHVVQNPRAELCERVGIDNRGAIGIMTITPGEGVIIAADVACKAADVQIEFVDRFTGCLIVSGDVSAAEEALKAAVSTLEAVLAFVPTAITRT